MEPRLRHIARSLDASRVFVDAVASTKANSADDPEPWPRQTRREVRRPRRRLILALWPLIAAVVAAQQLWDAKPDSAAAMPAQQAQASAPSPAPPPVAKPAPPPAPASNQLIHIKASRASSARFVIDEIELPWRKLSAGDEFFSRPRQRLVIETDDWESITATLNGKPIPLGPTNNVIHVR
jgi:hypothetical protein